MDSINSQRDDKINAKNFTFHPMIEMGASTKIYSVVKHVWSASNIFETNNQKVEDKNLLTEGETQFYQLAFSYQKKIGSFQPAFFLDLPIFVNNQYFRDFLVTKMINGKISALNSHPQLKTMREKRISHHLHDLVHNLGMITTNQK